jgi:hypothetical protein
VKNLNDVLTHIESLPCEIPFLGLDIAVWELVREEARDFYDGDLEADPEITQPNFLVEGVPIIQAGHA